MKNINYHCKISKKNYDILQKFATDHDLSLSAAMRLIINIIYNHKEKCVINFDIRNCDNNLSLTISSKTNMGLNEIINFWMNSGNNTISRNYTAECILSAYAFLKKKGGFL